MKKASPVYKGSQTAAVNDTVMSPHKAKGVTKEAPPSKTAAGGARNAFKDGGGVKRMPKMATTMKC